MDYCFVLFYAVPALSRRQGQFFRTALRETRLMPAIVDQEKCTGCGECIEACPLSAIEMDGDAAKVDEDTCSDCGACVDVCPVEAITVE